MLLRAGGTRLLMQEAGVSFQVCHELIIRILSGAGGIQGVMSCLIAACEFGHRLAARVLVEAGGEVLVNMAGPTGITPLHCAAARGDDWLLSVLLQAGARLHATAEGLAEGFTPLDFACARGHVEAVRTLVRAGGAELVRRVGPGGWTCMHSACAGGRVQVVLDLLSVGGRGLAERATEDGRTCLLLAARSGHRPVVELLRSLPP